MADADKPKVAWTAADRARHAAVRRRFEDRPTREELVASGEYGPPVPLGFHVGLRSLLAELKAFRERSGITLADVSERTGMDPAAVSRLETGRTPNPTVETLERYTVALGKRLMVQVVDAPTPG
jgi:DNA-binding Xre family transcriptional regulator